MKIKCKRIYDEPAKSDGTRILVDGLWPRGVSKEDAKLDHWCRDIAPSTMLRKWFNHDPAKWLDFKKKYFAELAKNDTAVSDIQRWIAQGPVTILFAAKDTEHNNAVALCEYLTTHP